MKKAKNFSGSLFEFKVYVAHSIPFERNVLVMKSNSQTRNGIIIRLWRLGIGLYWYKRQK